MGFSAQLIRGSQEKDAPPKMGGEKIPLYIPLLFSGVSLFSIHFFFRPPSLVTAKTDQLSEVGDSPKEGLIMAIET